MPINHTMNMHQGKPPSDREGMIEALDSLQIGLYYTFLGNGFKSLPEEERTQLLQIRDLIMKTKKRMIRSKVAH